MSGLRDHSTLGASNASRWINCPGSVAAEAGLPDDTSASAQEGTAAHALAQLALEKKQPPKRWLGEEVKEVVVTQDMVDNVGFYVDYVRAIMEMADYHWLEQKFDLAPLKPPVPMFGTADFGAGKKVKTWIELDVLDLKYGKGIAVNPHEGSGFYQTRYYALGMYIEIAKKNYAMSQAIKTIRLHIIQPRILDDEGNPTVIVATITMTELKAFAHTLLEAARKTQQQHAPRIAGDHCRFCKAKATCGTFRGAALAVAKTEFADLVEDRVKLPAPGDLTPEQVAKVLEHRDLLRDWLSSVEGHALGEIERGRSVPGWGRKPKRATRKWRDDKETVAWAEREFGATTEDLFDLAIKSPAQIEKLVGKGTIPGELVVAESSGYNLCHANDPKAIATAVTDFEPVD